VGETQALPFRSFPIPVALPLAAAACLVWPVSALPFTHAYEVLDETGRVAMCAVVLQKAASDAEAAFAAAYRANPRDPYLDLRLKFVVSLGSQAKALGRTAAGQRPDVSQAASRLVQSLGADPPRMERAVAACTALHEQQRSSGAISPALERHAADAMRQRMKRLVQELGAR
jgi:hypothetical protein